MNDKFFEKCHTGSLYDINDPELQKLENSIDLFEFQPLKNPEILQKLKKVLIFYQQLWIRIYSFSCQFHARKP